MEAVAVGIPELCDIGSLTIKILKTTKAWVYLAHLKVREKGKELENLD